MKSILRALTVFAMAIFLATACQSKEKSPGQMIAGEESKTWMAKKEYNAAGDKDKLDSNEKDERMTFYSNGKFNMKSNADTQSGTWIYNAGNKELQLTFTGASVTENFQVLELGDSKMELKGGDGSKMILKTE